MQMCLCCSEAALGQSSSQVTCLSWVHLLPCASLVLRQCLVDPQQHTCAIRSRGRLGHAVPSLSCDSLVLRQIGLGPLQCTDGWVPYSKYTFLFSSSVSSTVQMTGSPTVNTYAPVFLVWISHSTQMSGSPTVNTQVFIFLVCVPYSTDDWVPCSKYTCSYFSRQYTHVPIFEAVSSGSPTVHRRLGPLRSIHRCSFF